MSDNLTGDERPAGDPPLPPDEDEPTPIPSLRRGRGIRIRPNDIFRIGLVATLLVGIIALQRPCADGVARFITGFDESAAVDAGAPTADAGPATLGNLRRLTDDEIKAIFNGDAGSLLDDEPGGGPIPEPD